MANVDPKQLLKLLRMEGKAGFKAPKAERPFNVSSRFKWSDEIPQYRQKAAEMKGPPKPPAKEYAQYKGGERTRVKPEMAYQAPAADAQMAARQPQPEFNFQPPRQREFGMLDWLKKNPKLAAGLGIGGAGLGGAAAGGLIFGGEDEDPEYQDFSPQEYYM